MLESTLTLASVHMEVGEKEGRPLHWTLAIVHKDSDEWTVAVYNPAKKWKSLAPWTS